MGDEIRTFDTEGEGGVIDAVDEVVHFGRFDVHKPVHLGLRRGAGVFWEGRIGAAEDDAEVLVEMDEEPGVKFSRLQDCRDLGINFYLY